ncbi:MULTISPECIES: MarR family transcriptional regulator [unclassified Beijerinckia]|uniref:MarR family winged helix-turn-helix transcriptional regulator n=1 Tax=unclassified Beijerinckia TaxID=2638183 RepID=UPI000899F0E3|nr:MULTISPECIES: MarR family transcriptional regulator [unclassified Beijerinckia]MDH7794964.1 DNA-binding MarR family transcriptional regulator [Beijerinckia sp. GAS462]SEB82144.1 DNA-binding transcriptional regulator, MarR family [Beijerinckia sp. 28-YEA-48]
MQPPHEKLEDAIGFLMWDAARSLTKHYNQTLMLHGISVGVFPFLRSLWEKDGVTQRQLADRIGVTGSTTVVALRQLEQAGYIQRSVDEKDARKVLVTLTDSGRSLHALVIPEISVVTNTSMSDFTDQERQQLRSLLQRFRNNMSQGMQPRKPAKAARG